MFGRYRSPGKAASRVLRGGCDDLFHIVIAHTCDLGDRQHDVRRFVVRATQLLRRQERRVGLDDDAIEVDRDRGLSKVFVLRVRHVAGEADPVAARGALTCDRGVAAEAVDHHALGGTLIEDSKDVGPRVADMDHHRLARLVRQGDVGLQHPDLILGGRVHPEVVQAALPHTDHACVVQQFLDPGRGRLIEVGGVVRVHARRGEHTLEGIGQFGGTGARGGVDTDADQPVDARGLRGLDHLCRFVVEQEQVAVGVHRPGVSPWLKVLVAHERRAYKGLHIRSMRGASRETRFRQASPPSEGVVDNSGAAGIGRERLSRRPGGGTATRLWWWRYPPRGLPTPPSAGTR